MDASEEDRQKAKFLAFLLWSEIGGACTPEDLSTACIGFRVDAAEIRRLCKLPNAPLGLQDSNVAASNAFVRRLTGISLNSFKSCVSLLKAIDNLATCSSGKEKENGMVAQPELTREPTVARSDNDCANAFKLEPPANPEIRPRIESGLFLLPAEDGLAANGDMDYECGDVVGNNPLQGTECHLSSPHDAANVVINPLQGTECHLPALSSAHATNASNAPHRIEEAQLAAHSGKSPCKVLQQAEKADVATPHIGNLSITLYRTENSILAPAPACLVEQALELVVKEVNFQSKKVRNSYARLDTLFYFFHRVTVL